MKTIILGLGNLIFTDDAAGILVVRALKERVIRRDVTFGEASISGLDILENISGYERAFIIDAIQTEQSVPGSVYRLNLNQVSLITEFYSHNINLLTAIELGKKAGIPLPEEIVIFAIEVKDITSIWEECTEEIKAAIPVCVEKVIQELETDDVAG